MKAVALALDGKQAVLSDLFRSTDGALYLDAVAPVSDVNNRPVAVVVLRSDAEKYLFPIVQSWSIPSRSAETLLVQKEGDHILYLNRFPLVDGGQGGRIRDPGRSERPCRGHRGLCGARRPARRDGGCVALPAAAGPPVP